MMLKRWILKRRNKKIKIIESKINEQLRIRGLPNPYSNFNQIQIYAYMQRAMREASRRYGGSILPISAPVEAVMQSVEEFNREQDEGVRGIRADVIFDDIEEASRLLRENTHNLRPIPIKVVERNRCPICSSPLDDYSVFPDWYPEKWRICCYCVGAFKFQHRIVSTMSRSYAQGHYEKYGKEIEKRFNIQ